MKFSITKIIYRTIKDSNWIILVQNVTYKKLTWHIDIKNGCQSSD